MIVFSVLGALALAADTNPPAAEIDPDLRCFAYFSAILGTPDPARTAEMTGGLTSLTTYFTGKLDGRRPGANIEAELKALITRPDVDDILRNDAPRCAAEARNVGLRLQGLGNNLKPPASRKSN